jgi:hypothetical protein
VFYEFVTTVTDSIPARIRTELGFADIVYLYFHFEEKEEEERGGLSFKERKITIENFI